MASDPNYNFFFFFYETWKYIIHTIGNHQLSCIGYTTSQKRNYAHF